MARLSGLIRKMSGSAGDFTFKRSGGETVVSEKVTDVKNVRSSAQQRHRMKWANVVQMYKGLCEFLKDAFEGKVGRVTDYNAFVKINMNYPAAYLTKAQVAGGACIVAPYQVSQGSLPSIITTGTGSNRVTDISLGGLTIDETTTIGEVSNAIYINNKGYSYGDKISFISVLQMVSPLTGIPYARFEGTNIELDKSSRVPIWSKVNKAGFCSVNGYLGHGESEGDGAYCWIHSTIKNGEVRVSTQFLLDNNPLLTEFMGQDAYDTAVATYGGEKNNFLAPSRSSDWNNELSFGGNSGNDAGGNSGNDSGNSGNSGQQSGGGNSGDDDDDGGFGGGF